MNQNKSMSLDIDNQAFSKDVDALRKEVDGRRSPDDIKHLKKIEFWGRLSGLLGYATAWIVPNPVSAFLMSQAQFTRWASVTHHITHKGYDKSPDVPDRYTSKVYAKGWRRYVDWLDWIYPAGWDQEHNVFHHYYTGEMADPDLVENNVTMLRNLKLPVFLKSIVIFFFMCTWKWSYYAPNTMLIMQRVRQRKQAKAGERGELRKVAEVPYGQTNFAASLLVFPFNRGGMEFWLKCIVPMLSIRFALIPALFLPLGSTAVVAVFLNTLLADIFTNIHSFLMIVPSHAADDLYRFETPVTSREEFYVRQVIGSANYRTGSDLNDLLHGWLNYQIEHHLFPDLSMAQYKWIQPRVQALCEKHGVPYQQHSVFYRFKKLWPIMTGRSSMPVAVTS